MSKEVRIKYHHNNEDWKLKKIDKGDWIDVRACNIKVVMNTKGLKKESESNLFTKIHNGKTTVYYRKDDVLKIKLGFSMELPTEYEAYVLPRSSTFKNYGLLLVNSEGVIDESYCGNNDEWMMIFYATRDGEIELGERMGQFRIQEKMPTLKFIEVEDLGNEDRGGIGSTGVK
ncbi:TPA: dUTP diphosphatase [Clostridium botulinum]